MPVSRAVFDKIGEPGFCFRDSHPVQVDFGLNAEASAREFAHRATANCLTVKAQLVRIAALHCVDIVKQAVVQYLLFVRARELRLWFGLLRRFRDTLFGAQRLRARHRAAEQAGVVVAHVLALRLWCDRDIEYSERVASRQT